MKGNLVVISGPSGVGKDTLMALILSKINNLIRWVTVTTRSPRDGEVETVDYFFKSKEEFNNLIKNNELVEWNEFAGNFYGTPKKFAQDHLSLGHNVYTMIDVNGAMSVKENFNNANLIFIAPPSIDVLKKRLNNRGTETKEQIDKRLAIAKSELEIACKFDKVIINDNLEDATNELYNYITSIISM